MHRLVEHRLRVGRRLAQQEHDRRVAVLGERRRPGRRVDGSGQHRNGPRAAAGQQCPEALGQQSVRSALGGHDPPGAVVRPGDHRLSGLVRGCRGQQHRGDLLGRRDDLPQADDIGETARPQHIEPLVPAQQG